MTKSNDIADIQKTLQIVLGQNVLLQSQLYALKAAFVALAEESGYSADTMSKSLEKAADAEHERLLLVIGDTHPDAVRGIDLLKRLERGLDEQSGKAEDA